MSYVQLKTRSIIALCGPDVEYFLQSIITNDISKLDNQKAIYSLLLSPQGRYLYDFFLIRHGKYIIMECESVYLNQIIVKLNLLKTYLRVKIRSFNSSYKVGILFDSKSIECSDFNIIFQDPRHELLGMRIIHKGEIKQSNMGFINRYEKIRIQNLVPDGVKDMIHNLSFPLQYLIDKVNGISFDKGCYIGQEVVNRMKKQKMFRRRLYLIRGKNVFQGVIGTKLVNENNKEVGQLRSSIDNIGLALLDCNDKQNYTNLHIGKEKIFVVLD